MEFLAGWDQMLPEFFVKENILRSVFGVWQQYRGLGLYDGQSHAAELLHTLLVACLSPLIPQAYIRWVIIFALWLLGGVGAYVIFRKKIIAAVFYTCNLATIQMFYTPFEAFAFHFAALPWIAWAIQKKSLPIIALIFFLVSPQFFIPTLLLPTLIVIICLSGKRILSILTIFFLINAFWLLPFLYGIPKTAPTIMRAKINQMSSNEDLLRNRAFANPKDIILLRGYALDFQDFDNSGNAVFLMNQWRSYLTNPWITAVQFGLAAMALLGLASTFKKRNRHTLPFGVLFTLGFIFLGSTLLQDTIPILAEALRFPFTKFSLLFAFSYSGLIALGLDTISSKPAVEFIAGTLIFIQALPMFFGGFISQNMEIAFPENYTKLYTYMQKQDVNRRVLILPQNSYWSWKYYNFGYRGSGFLWFGIPQPTLDRAFDPWSPYNENYYWELSRALYSKDKTAIEAIIQKYDISYILLDEYVTSPNNNRALFIDETKQLLGPPTKTFGEISVWELPNRTTNFVSTTSKLTTVNSYSWTDNDVAFTRYGDYTTGTDGVIFPYRSLFTKRSVDERDFDIQAVLREASPVYDSTRSADLSADAVKPCGLVRKGEATATITNGAITFTSLNQRGCLSFDIPTLSHTAGYIVSVEHTHTSGRPLMISFINDTAKHVELETYLSSVNNEPSTNYFILPPLAPDGLGYTVYISNDAIGSERTVNTISRIRFFQIPYDELVHMQTGEVASPSGTLRNDMQVEHPNPAFYKITGAQGSTLILSQSYDNGWIAIQNGKLLPHVMVDNWKNGWTFSSTDDLQSTIYIFFWPQILEYIGLGILPFAVWGIIKKV